MKRLLALMIAVLLLLGHLVGAVGSNGLDPVCSGRAAYHVLLPVAERHYRRPEACLPRFVLPEELVLEPDRPAGLDMVHIGDFDGNGWTDLVVARLAFGTTRTFAIDVLLNDGRCHLEDGTSRLGQGL